MTRLENVSVADLQRALEAVDEAKPTRRLVAAIAYKNGVSQTELASWFDVRRRTIHRWFERIETAPLDRAVHDEGRPGRPRKLDEGEQARLRETLQSPPGAAGYDAATWTPELVQRHLAAAFDVDYSRPSCRRLMREAGLRYRHVPSVDTAGDRTTDETGGTARRWVGE